MLRTELCIGSPVGVDIISQASRVGVVDSQQQTVHSRAYMTWELNKVFSQKCGKGHESHDESTWKLR